jgi:hypothetical protein
VVIVRSTTGHTFGGYASAPWTSASSYTNVGGCFLFLVENPHNDAPTCFDCTNTGYAMGCFPTHGPLFGCRGCESDMRIFPTGDTAQSYTSFSTSYADTLGRGSATCTGAKNFTPEDYEVWAVI